MDIYYFVSVIIYFHLFRLLFHVLVYFFFFFFSLRGLKWRRQSRMGHEYCSLIFVLHDNRVCKNMIILWWKKDLIVRLGLMLTEFSFFSCERKLARPIIRAKLKSFLFMSCSEINNKWIFSVILSL